MNRKSSNGNGVHIFDFSIIMASDKQKQNVPKHKEGHAYHLHILVTCVFFFFTVVQKKNKHLKYINSNHRTMYDTGKTSDIMHV